MCGLCLEQGFIHLAVTEGYDAIKAEPEFVDYWFEFCDDWDAIVLQFKQQPDSLLSQRLLWARLFITSFDTALNTQQHSLWRHLAEELSIPLVEYPTLSQHLIEASQFPKGMAAYTHRDALNNAILLAEANALLERHLQRTNASVTKLHRPRSNSSSELIDKEYDQNRDKFFDACWQEFRHRLFACALLSIWAPDSTTLKRFALTAPHYAVDFFAFEYRLQRWALQLIYRKKGATFLASNAGLILPEHLLYLLHHFCADAQEISTVKQAYFAALSRQQASYPNNHYQMGIKEAFDTLSKRALSHYAS